MKGLGASLVIRVTLKLVKYPVSQSLRENLLLKRNTLEVIGTIKPMGKFNYNAENSPRINSLKQRKQRPSGGRQIK